MNLVRVQDIDVVVGPVGEPLFRDVDLGRALGLAKPTNVRQAARAHEKKIGPYRTTVVRYRGRDILEYALTKRQALFIASKSPTDTGADVLLRLIDVCDEYERQRQAGPAASLLLDVQHGIRVRDNRVAKDRLVLAVRRVVKERGYSLSRVHGYLRERFRVTGPYFIWLAELPIAVESLEHLETRKHDLPARRAALRVVNPWQSDLFAGRLLTLAKPSH